MRRVIGLIVSLARRVFGAARRTVNTAAQLLRYVSKGCKPIRVVLPSGCTPLSTEEFTQCCQIIDYYMAEGKQIIPYCNAHGRDYELYDRGNVWKEENIIEATTEMLLSKKYNNVNRLRLIGWHFASYRVFDLSRASVESIPNQWFSDFYSGRFKELPDDVDSIVTSAINPSWRIDALTPRIDKLLQSVDHKYFHSQPMRFSEIAGEYRGFMINGDSQRYWATMAVLARSKILTHLEEKIAKNGFCRVMEIGAGYGGLAYQLKKTYGDKLQFIAVDLVESLIFSACYLTTLLKDKPLYYKDTKTLSPDNGLVFVPSFRSPEFFDVLQGVDLCINTLSMNEMTEAQVDYYGRNISRTLSPDGIFYECNWIVSLARNRVNVKPCLAPHFKQRLTIHKPEASDDGNLDLWSNAMPASIAAACKENYLPPNAAELAWANAKAYLRRF